MKRKSIMPIPKQYCDRNNKGCVPAYILYDKRFAKAAEVFCTYAESIHNVVFKNVEGGIVLKYDKKLENEAYTIDCDESSITVTASQHKGMNNALSCLLGLISSDKGRISYDCCLIEDEPDVCYRTFMLDTARYPHNISYLYKYVDLCYMNRLSYFQIHLTDNENFTLKLPAFPKIKGKYSKKQLSALAKYAEARGITIIPEINVPGHSRALTYTYPEVFGECDIMSASENTFSALEEIFAYVHETFPNSPYIHIGGEEGRLSEWEKCKPSQAYMKEHGIESVSELYAEYIHRVSDIVFALGCTPIVWEGFAEEYNDRISKDVIVAAWESYYQTADRLVNSGFKIINASWVPLYIVCPTKYRSPKEILDWDIRTWHNWYEKSAAYPNGLMLKEDEGEVIGAQLCAWGDNFVGADDPEELCQQEYALVEERMPAFSERTWNALKK